MSLTIDTCHDVHPTEELHDMTRRPPAGAKSAYVSDVAVRLPHHPTSAVQSRRMLARGLVDSDLPQPVLDDALIVVSELVSNAVRHAQALADGCIELVWRLADNRLEIEVADGGPDRARGSRPLHASDEAGRGLFIVTALSEDVVVERAAHHSRTRAVLLVA